MTRPTAATTPTTIPASAFPGSLVEDFDEVEVLGVFGVCGLELQDDVSALQISSTEQHDVPQTDSTAEQV